MNVARFIANRIGQRKGGSFSASAGRIAVIGVALGLAVLIVSFSVLEGFKKNIKDKVAGLEGHLQVVKFKTGNDIEGLPFVLDDSLRAAVLSTNHVQGLQSYAVKAAMLTNKKDVSGVALKGVSADFAVDRFKEYIIEGEFIDFSDSLSELQILISQRLSDRLELTVGDEVIAAFIQDPPRLRKLKVQGIYKTYLEETDERMIIGHIGLIRKLNGWGEGVCSGMDIFLEDFSQISDAAGSLYDQLDYDLDIVSIPRKYYRLFDWFTLLDKNVVIILIIISFVVGFNMLATLFVMIMERTGMIGILKSIGASNRIISRIFLFSGFSIALKGLLFGNIIGAGFCFIQSKFNLIPLDPANYYMDTVPIHWQPEVILLLNAGVLLLVLVVLIIPAAVISRIKPVNALRFD